MSSELCDEMTSLRKTKCIYIYIYINKNSFTYWSIYRALVSWRPSLGQASAATETKTPRKFTCQSITLSVTAIFNRGSVEPKGSASVCQRFRGWPTVKWSWWRIHARQYRRNTASMFFLFKIAFLRVVLHRLTVESFLLLVKFWHRPICILGLYYNVRFLCTTLFNSKALSEMNKKKIVRPFT